MTFSDWPSYSSLKPQSLSNSMFFPSPGSGGQTYVQWILIFFRSLLKCHLLMSFSLASLTHMYAFSSSWYFLSLSLLDFLPSLITFNILCVLLFVLIYYLPPSTRLILQEGRDLGLFFRRRASST